MRRLLLFRLVGWCYVIGWSEGINVVVVVWWCESVVVVVVGWLVGWLVGVKLCCK